MSKKIVFLEDKLSDKLWTMGNLMRWIANSDQATGNHRTIVNLHADLKQISKREPERKYQTLVACEFELATFNFTPPEGAPPGIVENTETKAPSTIFIDVLVPHKEGKLLKAELEELFDFWMLEYGPRRGKLVCWSQMVLSVVSYYKSPIIEAISGILGLAKLK